VTITFDLDSGVRVTCDVGYLCANFSPLYSRRRPDVRDRRQTASSLNAPPIRVGSIKMLYLLRTRVRCTIKAFQQDIGVVSVSILVTAPQDTTTTLELHGLSPGHHFNGTEATVPHA